ncbi:MAG: 4-hydroxy-4-methyl-2-oxoglutarate aldolase [Chloroflexota bacterium]|nr:4-hydroxy-4-methyl-2-oxoglutarate aldolase [Dehalococcoidia bacterium]MDW8255305.1 4-hydroxy-4-methyl-2-oxoglutarate aldolase [Chloroflexota bacterium]
MNRIVRAFPRPAPDVIATLATVPTQALASSHALGTGCLIDPAIRPLRSGARVCGPALTVRPNVPSILIPLYAVRFAQPGDVIVVDAGGRLDVAVWGAGMTRAAQAAGIAGVIVDGAVVDGEALASAEIAVYARGVSPAINFDPRPGSINVAVQCGGRRVEPGDLIHADGDGAVVIPRARFDEAIEAARWWREQVAAWGEQVRAGRTLFEALGFDREIERLGIPEE